jgi:hypothetical protein
MIGRGAGSSTWCLDCAGGGEDGVLSGLAGPSRA